MSEQSLATIEDTPLFQGIMQTNTLKEELTKMLGDNALVFVNDLKLACIRQPALLKCTPESVLHSALSIFQDGLSLDPAVGEAYLVPFNNRVKGPDGKPVKGPGGKPVWKKEATKMPGYRGYIQAALQSGRYKIVGGRPVTSRMLAKIQEIMVDKDHGIEDVITFLEGVEFFPDFMIGKIEGYIAYYLGMQGETKHIYWTRQQCLEHGKKYGNKFDDKSGFWQTSEDTMCLKTVYRQLFTKWALKGTGIRKMFQQEQFALQQVQQGALPPIPGGDDPSGLFEGDDEQSTEHAQALELAYAYIDGRLEKLEYPHPHRVNSFNKHLGVGVLRECQDIDKLREYGKYLLQQEKDAYAKRHAAAATEDPPIKSDRELLEEIEVAKKQQAVSDQELLDMIDTVKHWTPDESETVDQAVNEHDYDKIQEMFGKALDVKEMGE